MPDAKKVTAEVIEAPPPRAKKKATASTQIDLGKWNYDETKCVIPPLDPLTLAQLYSRNTAHKACVDAKTVNAVGLGWHFDPVEGEEENKDLGPVGVKLTKWLNNCAKRDDHTFDELITLVRRDEECVGWGAFEITRDGSGKIDGFFHVPAYTLRRRVAKDGWAQKVQGEYVYFRSYGRTADDLVKEVDKVRWEADMKEAHEIVVFGEITPDSPYYPMPDHVPALGDMTGDEAAQAYQNQYFENNAVPRLAILVSGGKLDAETKAYVIEYLRDGLKGSNQKTLILETEIGDGIKLQLERLTSGGSDREDASYTEYRRECRNNVIMAHRVSPSKVTIVENANLANSKDQDKTFKEQVVRPDQNRYERRIQWLLEDEFGEDLKIEFHFDEMDVADELAAAQRDNIYSKGMTTNEMRDRAGLPKAGIDPETGEVFDEELEAWGRKQFGSGIGNPMAPGFGGGNPFEQGGDNYQFGGTPPFGSTPDQQAGAEAAAEKAKEVFAPTAKRLAAEHQEFAAMVRELGYIIERIDEVAPENVGDTVRKAIDEAIRPEVNIEKGAVEVHLPAPKSGKTKKTVHKEFIKDAAGLIVGVNETTEEV